MSEKLKVAKEKLQQINSKIEELQTEREMTMKFIEEVTLLDKLYSPMSELKNHIGKEISSIDLVYMDECSNLKVFRLDNDESCGVNTEGRLYYSSYEGGIINYDNDTDCYISSYYGCHESYNFVGYYNLEFEVWEN